jgi:hypothetical protein
MSDRRDDRSDRPAHPECARRGTTAASVGQGDRRMTIALSIFLTELNVTAGTPNTADSTRVLEVVEGTLGREHDVADMLVETPVVEVVERIWTSDACDINSALQ